MLLYKKQQQLRQLILIISVIYKNYKKLKFTLKLAKYWKLQTSGRKYYQNNRSQISQTTMIKTSTLFGIRQIYQLNNSSSLKNVSLTFKRPYWINTQIIKKHHQQVTKANPRLLRQYPKTFQQKAVVLNDPKMIQAIQIIQYGVQYKPGKKYLFLFLVLIGAFTFFHQQILPQRIVDGYFAVSTQMDKGFSCGYLLAPFTYQKPFIMFLPLMAVVFQMSKFVKTQYMALLILANMITSGILGKYLVNQRVKQYQVWDQERILYGQANLLSIGTGFWTMLGFMNGFNALKARIMLKAIPGAGIMRAGLPIGYILSVYIAYFIYTYFNQSSKNNQIAAQCVLNSIIWGLLMRRFTGFVPK